MMMTSPNEFLQFANEMGLGRIKSTSSSASSSPLIPHNNGFTTTGLSVLNNLCRLIEQIHQLKSENNRLRAHLELINHVEQFQERFKLKDRGVNDKDNLKHEPVILSTSVQNEEQSNPLCPSNSLKSKSSLLNRERKGTNFVNNHEESSTILTSNIQHSELIAATNISVPPARYKKNWSKVRHALKFTLRRKQSSPSSSPPIQLVERPIPTISISLESDDDHLQEKKPSLKKKKTLTVTTFNDNQQKIAADETDQEYESSLSISPCNRRKTYENQLLNSSSIERQEISSTNLSFNTLNIDDDPLLIRKQSKIARYRRKLRSKIDTVKKQFSDQNSSTSSMRFYHASHGSIFDEIGSGLNHALITAQLAPALTESYQQKMREWENMQKSQFLVNYRRQSITPKTDVIINSRKTSPTPTMNEMCVDELIPSLTIENCPSIVDGLNVDIQRESTLLSPILSPNQRSLIVHQWREIMFEEMSLRRYDEYLRNQLHSLKELEANLKTLKANIFCTNDLTRQQSAMNTNDYQQSYLPRRCRSLQSLVSMPASWILAVQSAAYSDVLDGTSTKTSERAILFDKDFFDQLAHFKRDRRKFQQSFIEGIQFLNCSTKIKKHTTNKTHSNKPRFRLVPTRGSLRKLSLMSYAEFPQYFLPYPMIPLQTVIPQPQSTKSIEHIETIVTDETDLNKQLSLDNVNKQSKRIRFDFKKTFQRSKSMCLNQLNSWLQRRRHTQLVKTQRSSTLYSKAQAPHSTPTLFGSPRLARLHQKLFRHQREQTVPKAELTPIPLEIADDSDNRSEYDLPVRIYFPPLTTPMTRHIRIADTNILTSMNCGQHTTNESDIRFTTAIIDQTNSSSLPSLKLTTAKERRQSFLALSSILNNKRL